MEKLIPYQEWMSQQIWNTSYIIDQLLTETPGEFMIIAGKPGIGKSMLALHLAFCLATGTPFLGFKTQPSTVGYMAFEGSPHNMRERFEKIRTLYPDSKDMLQFNFYCPMQLEKCYKDFKSILNGCKVVIFDNLRQITGNKYMMPDYASTFIKTLEELLREIGANAVITHHIKKRDDRYIFEEGDIFSIKGATEYVDAATSAILMERKPRTKDKSNLMLYFPKHRVAVKDLDHMEVHKNLEKYSFDMVENEK